jgi:hypothetical protein
VGKLFNRQTIGVVHTLSQAERDDKGIDEYHGGWVLTETAFLWLRKRRAAWFGDSVSVRSNYGKIRSAAVDCWVKGGPVPTQYLDAPTREKPKLNVVGGTDEMRR